MNRYLTIIANNEQFGNNGEQLNDFLKRNNLADEKIITLSEKKAIRLDLLASSDKSTASKHNIETQHDLVINEQDNLDFVAVLNNYDHFKPELVVFDMDSTLIYQEVIEMIAFYADVEPQVKEITDRAMNNEIDFQESLKQRVGLLKGLPFNKLYDEICQKIKLTNGVLELTRFLHNINSKTAVLSGGFEPFAKFIQNKLELDYMRANNLEIDASTETLTGNVLGEIVDGKCKAETLIHLATEKNNFKLENTIMIGDGGNDLPAMQVAGYGVAWNAKPRVQQAAPSKLNSKSLLDVCYILGYSENEINDILSKKN